MAIENLDVPLTVRLTTSEADTVRATAARAGLRTPAWIRQALRDASMEAAFYPAEARTVAGGSQHG